VYFENLAIEKNNLTLCPSTPDDCVIIIAIKESTFFINIPLPHTCRLENIIVCQGAFSSEGQDEELTQNKEFNITKLIN
jgi:hypothetical protein